MNGLKFFIIGSVGILVWALLARTGLNSSLSRPNVSELHVNKTLATSLLMVRSSVNLNLKSTKPYQDHKVSEPYVNKTLASSVILDASHAAQLKPAWYWQVEGTPEVAILIPRESLENFRTSLASGGKAGGLELTTSAYPEAGHGGFLQFSAKTGNIPKSL